MLVAACDGLRTVPSEAEVLVPAGPIGLARGADEGEPSVGERALAAPAPAGPPSRAGAAAPNVLFLVWDTVRADKLSLYGHPRPTTPNLDAFAARGVVYERAISPGVWTLPSHASMFTGLPVSAHGVSDGRKYLDDGFVTVAEVLQRAGYDTYAWSANPFVSTKTNLTQGFDKVEHPWSPAWKRKAATLQRERSVEEVSTGLGKSEGAPWGYPNVGGLADRALTAFLAQREEGRPWFAFVNLMEAHSTRSPVLSARERVMDAGMLQASLQLDQRTRVQHAWMAGTQTWTDEQIELFGRVYEASIAELDHATGRLLDELQRSGELDHTIVVLVADHGELLGEHGLMGHQLGIWNALTRVPLVVVAPGQLEPSRVAEPFSTAGLYRMILQMTGVEVPPAGQAGLDASRQELGVVTEYTEAMRSTFRILKQLNPSAETDRFNVGWTAIERGPYKLMRSTGGQEWLFDVSRDPGERSPQREAEVQAELARQLDAWKGTFARFDHEHAEPVREPIDEGEKAMEALRELGYAE